MEYLINLGILFCIYGVLALSLNMVVGMTGLLSLAPAAFYGIGAYATAIVMTRFGVNFFASLLIGAVINIAVAYIVGKILSRFRSGYYAIVSAGLAIIVYSLLLNWKDLTNGPLGIFGIPKPSLFGLAIDSNSAFFVLSLIVLALIFALYRYIDKSSYGRGLKAIREDEQLATAVIAGIAGALFASYIAFIDPSTFQVHESIFLFTIIIIGGLASSVGSIVGALILLSLPEILRFVGLPYETAAQLQQIIYGLTLILIMVYKPRGLFGKYRM